MRLAVWVLAGLVISAATPAIAQTDNGTWQHIVALNGSRGEVKAMQIAANGDIVVAGFIPKPESGSGRALSDGWVARYAPDGRELWSRTVGGPVRDEAMGLDVGADGSIAVVGWRDIAAVQTHFAFAAKFTAEGAQLWETVLRDAYRSTFATDVLLTEDGGLLFAGVQRTQDESTRRSLLVRLDAAGGVVWDANPQGKTEEVYVTRPDGTQAKVVSVFSSQGSAIGALDADGSVEMLLQPGVASADMGQHCVVLSLADGKATGTACAKTLPGNRKPGEAYVGGKTGSFGASDVQITKYRADGTVAWQRQPKTPWGDGINAVAQMPDGGVVGAGFRLATGQVEMHNWDGLLMRFDAGGRLLWSKTFGGKKRDEFTGVAVLADGSIVVAGYTGSQTDAPDWAPWIMRLNAEGELE